MQTLSQFFSQIPVLYKTAALLLLSNCFMTFAWYAHLKNLGNSPLWVAIISSWLIAFFEYCIMVPANRIGFSGLSLGQLKNPSGSHLIEHFCSVCLPVHEAASETGLSVGFFVHARRRLLHVPRQALIHCRQHNRFQRDTEIPIPKHPAVDRVLLEILNNEIRHFRN